MTDPAPNAKIVPMPRDSTSVPHTPPEVKPPRVLVLHPDDPLTQNLAELRTVLELFDATVIVNPCVPPQMRYVMTDPAVWFDQVIMPAVDKWSV